ncbi:MAG: hypothetical protein U0V48_12470 [Anaerolineales bacterium]
MYKDTTASLFDSFAALLEYPSSDFGEETQRCLELMRSTNPEAAELCEKFANAIEGYSPQRMQELFTTTFDMQPVCYPYIGFHLYGESYKRGAFMAQLNEAYHGVAWILYRAGIARQSRGDPALYRIRFGESQQRILSGSAQRWRTSRPRTNAQGF